MKTRHTPGPIYIEGPGTLLHPVTGSPLTTTRFRTTLGTFEVLDETNEPPANAERLAHCWNCHDELVEALELLTDCAADLDQTATSNGLRNCDALAKARAALAKAKQ